MKLLNKFKITPTARITTNENAIWLKVYCAAEIPTVFFSLQSQLIQLGCEVTLENKVFEIVDWLHLGSLKKIIKVLKKELEKENINVFLQD